MSLVALQLETGRTHQIRVHMAYLGHPLIGDFLYNPAYAANQLDCLAHAEENGSCMGKKAAADLLIHRQALHAHKISFPHPMTGKPMEFSVSMPTDMKNLMKI